MELASLTEDIHSWEASQNTDLDIIEFLRSIKPYKSCCIQGELVVNTSKLTEINEGTKKETKKLKKVEDGPIYYEEQRQ